MAQLKDTLIQGSARVTDTLFTNILNTITLNTDTLNTSLIQSPTNLLVKVNTSSAIITVANFSDTSFLPGITTSARYIGSADARWDNIYGKAGNFNGTVEINTLQLTNALGIGYGGTGKASWTQWGILYASATNTLAQVDAGAAANKFQVLTSNGAAAPIWKSALIMNHDVQTLATLSITNMNDAPIGVTRAGSGAEAGAITNAPITSCGGMVYTFGGYNGSASTYRLQFYVGADFDRTFVRRKNASSGSAWGEWYRLPRISKTTNTAIGGAKTPVYVNTSGEIVAGDVIKNLAYKDSLAASDIPNISTDKLTSGTLGVTRGGTGAGTFTADCVIVGNGTNAMASRGLKVTDSSDNITIAPNVAAGTLTLKTTNNTANLTITSGNVLYLDSGSSAAHVFRRGTTEDARFNGSGFFQLGDNGNQSTHRLYVNGNSAFNGKLAFGAQSSNTITENASIQYDATLNAIKFVFDPNNASLTYASGNSF